METTKTPSFFFYLGLAAVLAIVGWGGLAAVITLTLPTPGPRWLFFFFGVLAVSGTAMPVIAFLHRRFPSQAPAGPGVVIRQAAWLAIYISTLAWLQPEKMVNPTSALLLALLFIVIEALLRMRERARWQPKG